MEHYVYTATDEYGAVVYVGSGSSKRIEHVNSGKSHSKGLNLHTLTQGSLTVTKVAEGLSKKTSLRCEQDYIDLHQPIYNLRSVVLSDKPEQLSTMALDRPDDIDGWVVPTGYGVFNTDDPEFECDYQMFIAARERSVALQVAQMNRAHY